MQKKTPLRSCISCREQKNKSELVRVIRTPEGTVLLDKTGKANGRGAYICNSKKCFEKAIKRNAFNSSLKVSFPADVYEEMIKEIDFD